MDNSKKKKADFKVVILGESGVGKTSLIRRYIDGEFNEGLPNTIGAAFFLKQWKGKNIALWDTAGQEEFYGLTNFYCRSANAVILCYDISSRLSYDTLLERHSRLLESVARQCIMVFVGTKTDILNKKIQGKQITREVNIEEVMEKSLEYTKSWNSLQHPLGVLPIFETSSKLNENVSDVFEYIFETLVPATCSSLRNNPSPSGIIEFSEDQRSSEMKPKKCCSI